MNRKAKYRDIDKWRNTCYKQRRKYYSKTANAENSGQRWTVEEIDMVLQHNITDTEISEIIGRSVQSIQVMRSKLKKEFDR